LIAAAFLGRPPKIVPIIDKSYQVGENDTMNTILTHPPNILTPEQAAAYLQVDRETVYRYIRSGKLVASKLGRAYRIPKQSIELLLWVTRTRPDISLREYTGSEIDEFMSSDLLDDAAQTIVNQINHATRSQ